MSDVLIRLECPDDAAAIGALSARAFAASEHGDNGEAAIVERLRADRELALSLVADEAGKVVGHAAISPVTVGGGGEGWFGLGPVSVEPTRQRRGIGRALIEHGITLLAANGARGVVVLGDPAYYARFGFTHDPALTFPGPPPEYFQRLVFTGELPSGTVRYARAFG